MKSSPNDRHPGLRKFREAKLARKQKAIEKQEIRQLVIDLHPDWTDQKVKQVVNASYRSRRKG